VKLIESPINYNYKTIKLTRSRINKGLLAIPISLIDNFPKTRGKIHIYFDESKLPEEKNYTPFESTSRECRIGGMTEFYQTNKAEEGDEIVILFLGKNGYRILMEEKYKQIIGKHQRLFDVSKSEDVVKEKIEVLSGLTNTNREQVVKSEFLRLSKQPFEKRLIKPAHLSSIKENVPHSVRKILEEIYQGRCQLTNFTLKMRNGKFYFETHHLKPNLGHHLKNIVVICPNVHAQFGYSRLKEYYDNDGWLRRVQFDGNSYNVTQYVDSLPKKYSKEVHITNLA
jgi:hypothetical protein